MYNIPRILISGTHRSSGKTTVSIGLLDAWRRRGIVVQPFKKGPDYIDPMWLSTASGRACRNLDFHMMGNDNILRSLQTHSADCDLALIEGNVGLYDGLDLEGKDSTAGLAHLLKTPVILVVDTSRMNRGIAPLLLGYTKFDPALEISGVILNRVGNPRHESKLRRAVERYSGLEVLGAIHKTSADTNIAERHLGLIPIDEAPELEGKIGVISRNIEQSINIDAVYEIAKTAPALPEISFVKVERNTKATVRIGVAMDRAFIFYYPENLDALANAGAVIVPFSPLSDERLPDVDALYIGGGFPEVFMDKLCANKKMRENIKTCVENQLPVYAECGGLMYLARSITWNGEKREMVGALPCDIEMTKKPQGMGYVILESTGASSWLNLSGAVTCHEFHHSRICDMDKMEFAWNVTRGVGIDGKRDGLIHKNVFASYAHLHHLAAPSWATSFVDMAKQTAARK